MSTVAKTLAHVESKLNGEEPSSFTQEELIDFRFTLAQMILSGEA